MLGIENAETLRAKEILQDTRDKVALAKLRFREGARLHVTAGPYAGKSGTVERLLLNHVQAYLIRPEQGELFQAADSHAAWGPAPIDNRFGSRPELGQYRDDSNYSHLPGRNSDFRRCSCCSAGSCGWRKPDLHSGSASIGERAMLVWEEISGFASPGEYQRF